MSIAPPEPGLSISEMLVRAEMLRPILRQRQDACEQQGRIAMDLIFRSSGSSSAMSDALIGRIFRGLAVLRTHLGAQRDPLSIILARMHFGLPPLGPLTVPEQLFSTLRSKEPVAHRIPVTGDLGRYTRGRYDLEEDRRRYHVSESANRQCTHLT